MSGLLDIVQQEARIDGDKLRALCSRKNISDYFGIEKNTFLELSEAKKMQLTKKFYFENVNFPAAKSVVFSIGNAIQNSSGINLTKITENDGVRTEMSLLINPLKRKNQRVSPCGKISVFSEVRFVNLTSRNLICLRILYFT